MVIILDNPEYTKPRTEYVIIVDISDKIEAEKIEIVQGHFNDIYGLSPSTEYPEQNEFERELHYEEFPDLTKDSQLKNLMTVGTSSVDVSVQVNTGTDHDPNYDYKFVRMIVNNDPTVNLELINKEFKQPRNLRDVLKYKNEIAQKKYEATCYKINPKKYYKKIKKSNK